MIEFMKTTREIYYKERKKFSFRYCAYNQLIKPSWMHTLNDNRYEATYRDQQILIREGRIAIAKIVQANSLLFKPGRYNSPAAMIFSEDPYFEENTHKLRDIASCIYELKGNNYDDEELQNFSDILADEKVTQFNVVVPQKITYGKKVYFTTFVVHREHLPKGYIDFSFFSALVYPEKTEASIILPSRYWANELSKRKKIKILSNMELMDFLETDLDKFIDVIQEHIDYAIEKSRTSWSNKAKWLKKVAYYRLQSSTALNNYGRHYEAQILLEVLLSSLNIVKMQEYGSSFYINVLSNLVSTHIALQCFEDAKINVELIEKTLSNCKDKPNIESHIKLLKWKQMELDILNGDVERGGQYLKSLLETNSSKTSLGSIYMYLGIYHYKRNENDKALEFFISASDLIKTPYLLKQVQVYIKNLEC